MQTLFINIKNLIQVNRQKQKWIAGKDMAKLNCIENAYLHISNGLIVDYGKMENLPELEESYNEVDVTGRLIMPTFCDSHTHIVYAGSRELEYVDKIKGLSYEEIAKRGGGILNSAKLLAKTSKQELIESALLRVHEMIGFGTGAIEIKSGYGLSLAAEIKMLEVIKELKSLVPIPIKATFLGAHAIPMEYKSNPDKYVDLVVYEMIPEVVKSELADYIDVFCDKGFFTVEQTQKILEQGSKYGLKPKIHANELGYSGGVKVGTKNEALSVDHLEFIGAEEIECLLKSDTMPTILPGAAFFLNMQESPVRKMMDAGLPIALASDYNPGSSPSGNMKFIMSLGCINYKMTPEEVINATTLNSAYAMGLNKTHGSIDIGKKANFIITSKIPGYEYLPYAYTSNLIDEVVIGGNFV